MSDKMLNNLCGVCLMLIIVLCLKLIIVGVNINYEIKDSDVSIEKVIQWNENGCKKK